MSEEWDTSYQDYLKYGGLKKPGQHILICGMTGQGKTTCAKWLVDGLSKVNKKDTPIWLDQGKNEEVLTLLLLGECVFWIPPNNNINLNIIINDPEGVYNFEIKRFVNLDTIWQNIVPGKINVICLRPYILDPDVWSEIVSILFENLIFDAYHKKLNKVKPLSVFIDEFHMVAPSSAATLGRGHSDSGAIVQYNLEQLRAFGIRIVGMVQAMTKLRRGCRTEFMWQIAKKGTRFTKGDEAKLSQYNGLFEKLEANQLFICNPERNFSKNAITIPPYKEGVDIGIMDYGEHMLMEKQKRTLKIFEETPCLKTS